MIDIKKVDTPIKSYTAKVIPLAFDESMSYYQCICNIANHINNEVLPVVNDMEETVITLSNDFKDLQDYVDDNMLTKDVDDLTYYTKTSDLSTVATTGDYDDLIDKPTIPDVSNFITKDVNDLTNYTLTTNLSTVATSGNYNDLSNKPTIPDVSNFITKDVNDLTNYTLTSSLSSVATSGSYNDLSNKPTIPTIPTNVSAFTNDSGYITNTVNDLTNYTTSSVLTTLLSGKENSIVYGSNTNGYYMKFDNGVLIEWNKMTVDDQAIESAYGSLYQGTRVITFPIAFVGELPTVQCSEFHYGSSGSWGCVVGNATSLTTTTLRGWDCYSRARGTNCTISWIAIGKWK